MKIDLLNATDSRHEIICDVYAITGINSFEELLKIYTDYQERYPDCAVLLTLDDLAQAQYTSMHAIGMHHLDNIDGYDLSSVDKSAFENGEHLGYLTTKSEFFIRKGNFEKRLGVTFDDICGYLSIIEEDEEMNVLETIHKDPLKILDDELLMYVVPVQHKALSLCVFPNGYFDRDFTPFQNYALATYLENRYQYKLMGIGASCIGFIRDEMLEPNAVEKLAIDIAKLYGCEDAGIVKRFNGIISDNKYLFLKYTESLDFEIV